MGAAAAGDRGPLAALLVAVALAGCDLFVPEPVRVGILVWPPYELAFIARDLGYLDGANIELVDFESPAVVQRAYRDGVIDAVAMTADYVLEMAQHEPIHRIALVIDVSHGGDVLVARPEIETLADLRGRSVGVESSALGAYMLRRALDHAGITVQDIDVVTADIPDQERLYLQGAVDAVVTYEPTRTQLIAAGAREIFSSRNIPGEIVDVLIARREVLSERAEDFAVFVRGWLRALDYLRSHPAEAAARAAPRQGVTPAQFLAALDGVRIPDARENLALLGGARPALRETLERHVEAMLTAGTLERRVDPGHLLEPRFVERSAAP